MWKIIRNRRQGVKGYDITWRQGVHVQGYDNTSHGSLVHWDNKTFRVGTYTVFRWAPEYSGPRPVNLSVFI